MFTTFIKVNLSVIYSFFVSLDTTTLSFEPLLKSAIIMIKTTAPPTIHIHGCTPEVAGTVVEVVEEDELVVELLLS